MKKMKKYLLVGLMSICLMFGIAAGISANTTSFTNLRVLGSTYLPTGYTSSANDYRAVVTITNIVESYGVTIKATKATEVNYGAGTKITANGTYYVYYANGPLAQNVQILASASSGSALSANYITGTINY